MLNQSFSEINIRRLVVGNDLFRYEIEREKEEVDRVVSDVVEKITKGLVDFDLIKSLTKKGKRFYIVQDFAVDLVIRKVNDSIRRIYKVKQSDRTRIVKQISSLIREESPKHILKLDIKDFYESINRDKIINKLIEDRILSYQSIQYIKKLFGSALLKDEQGLPRGIGISATLSELFLRDFDKSVMRMEGVYYYSRYVDDIIIFSIYDTSEIQVKINNILQKYNLNLNDNKTKRLDVVCNCLHGCKCKRIPCDMQTFDHLGYQFTFGVKPQNENTVVISIAEKKIKKIKTRIVESFLDYIKTNNIYMLKKRLKFITGTYYINKPNLDGRLKAGIRYSYNLINSNSVIEDLNSFLRGIIFAQKGSLGSKLKKCLTPAQRKELSVYCFKFGFIQGITHNFTASEIKLIKKCWLNEKH